MYWSDYQITNESNTSHMACPSLRILSPMGELSFALDAIGIGANLFCSLVFIRILLDKKPNEGHMFKLLLGKSLCDTVSFFVDIFGMAKRIGGDRVAYSYVMCVWFIGLDVYVRLVTLQCSGLFELAATFDCYVVIIRKHKCKCCLKRTYFYVTTGVCLASSILYYVYIFFAYTIVEVCRIVFLCLV